jgi:hypothetical protein
VRFSSAQAAPRLGQSIDVGKRRFQRMKIPMKFSPEMRRRVALMTVVKHAGKITPRAADGRVMDGALAYATSSFL